MGGWFGDFIEDTVDYVTEDIPRSISKSRPKDYVTGNPIFDIDPFGTRKEDDFDISPPSATASKEEIDQFNLALEDFQLQREGFTRVALPDGGFAIKEIPDARLKEFLGESGAERVRQNRSIGQRSRERLNLALAGELPVPLSFKRASGERREEARVRLARGPGEFSTPGIQKFGQLQESEAIIEDAIRRGEITAAQGINLQQQQTTAGIQSDILRSIQTGRFGAADIGFRQQDLETQLKIAEMSGRFGQKASEQELIGSVIETLPFILKPGGKPSA
jgi:hypothetical protein